MDGSEDGNEEYEQEVAVAEWARGANPVACKWVKQQGQLKGYDFDASKFEQIFDLLLKEKQLKLPEGHKIPTAQRVARKNLLQVAQYLYSFNKRLQSAPKANPVGH